MKIATLIETLQSTYPDRKFGKMDRLIKRMDGQLMVVKTYRLKTSPVEYFKTIGKSGDSFYLYACGSDYIRYMMLEGAKI